MHHFVSIDFPIVAAFYTTLGCFFPFVQTFLTVTFGIASALVLPDMTLLFFLDIRTKSGGPGYRQAEQTVVNVYFANCIRQPESQLPRPIRARILQIVTTD